MYKKPIQPDDAFRRLEVDINPGKLSDFIAVAHDLFRTMDAEGGHVGLWLLSQRRQDRLPHPRALPRLRGPIAHSTNFGNVFAERVMAACTPTKLILYGAPNTAEKAIMEQYGAIYFTKIRHYSEDGT
jgi:hypothetical protein